jgi:hypothetical protein
MFKTYWISINFECTRTSDLMGTLKFQLALLTMITLRWSYVMSNYFSYRSAHFSALISKYKSLYFNKKLKFLSVETRRLCKEIEITPSKSPVELRSGLLSLFKIVTFINHYRTGIIKQIGLEKKTIWSDKCLMILNILVDERCIINLDWIDRSGDFHPQKLSKISSGSLKRLVYPINYWLLTNKNNVYYYLLIQGNYGKA